MAKLEQRGFATSFISTKPSGNRKVDDIASTGIIHCHFFYFTLLIIGNVKGILVKRVSKSWTVSHINLVKTPDPTSFPEGMYRDHSHETKEMSTENLSFLQSQRNHSGNANLKVENKNKIQIGRGENCGFFSVLESFRDEAFIPSIWANLQTIGVDLIPITSASPQKKTNFMHLIRLPNIHKQTSRLALRIRSSNIRHGLKPWD